MIQRRLPKLSAVFVAWICAAGFCRVSLGQEDLPKLAEAKTNAGVRWLYVCCGLPGDDVHRERMTDACREWILSSAEQLDVDRANLIVTVGDETMQRELENDHVSIAITTIETMTDSLNRLSDEPTDEDSVWVVLIGHALLYEGNAQFNIQGPDVDQEAFAKLAATVTASEQVFWITTPVSGYWLRPLKMPGRVVISATEPDLEYTGTEMPYAVADLLAGKSDRVVIEDIDGDGVVSLLDLYLATCVEVHGRFEALDRLQTEHGLLDDNEDGRGTEIQLNYLPSESEEPDAEFKPKDGEDDESTEIDLDSDNAELAVAVTAKPAIITNQNRDGFRSRHILLKVN